MRWAMLLLIGIVGSLWCYADARLQATEPVPREFAKPTPIQPGVDGKYSPTDDSALVCDSPDSRGLHASIRSTLPLDPFPRAVYC